MCLCNMFLLASQLLVEILIHIVFSFFYIYFSLQNKDTADSRSRGGSNTSTRGGRGGTDRYGGRGGAAHFSSNGRGAF